MFLRVKYGGSSVQDKLNIFCSWYPLFTHPLFKVSAMFGKRKVRTVKTKHIQYLTICSLSESCFCPA